MIAVVTPIWQRYALTELCLRYWSTWDADVTFVVVGSEGPISLQNVQDAWGGTVDEDGAWTPAKERLRGFYLEHPNQPLGAKFNAGIEYAKGLSPDYVMIMGSDVLVHDSIFEDYAPHMEAGVPFIGVYDTYIYDTETARAYYWPGYRGDRKGEVIGPGRLYSSELLDSLGWRVYPDTFDRNLDGGADVRLPDPVGIWGKDHCMLSVKTPTAITRMSGYMAGGAYEVPTARLHFRGVDFTQL